MELQRLVEVSDAVAATRSRNAKRDLLAALLHETPPDEIEIATAWLSGTLRQRRTGVGWRGLATLPAPAPAPALSLTDVDAALEELSGLSGPGSGTARAQRTSDLFTSLTADEQRFLRAVMTGQVRQGALDSVMLDAIAAAAGVPLSAVRRAAMFSAPTGPVALAALAGGEEALAAFRLEVGRPVRPMLAASAPSVADAVAKLGGPFAVDAKLDGIRIQVHRDGDAVSVFTRSLDEVGWRLPEVVAATLALPEQRLILDGEALGVDGDGRPQPFQDTASASASTGASIFPFFFDALHVGSEDLLDAPLTDRLARLDAVVPEARRVSRLIGSSAEEAGDFFDRALEAGHEGVVLKRLDAPYDAGRRGSAWVKVKPRHTLDLVVLAVEHGSGRRRGHLSNIHLGARDPRGGFTHTGWVPVGKTFKGMTDEMLAWQTRRFRELAILDDGWVVTLRPEQLVEIAFDGVQRSSRYPGGVALRFARVLRYRDDKPVSEADTIETLRNLLGK